MNEFETPHDNRKRLSGTQIFRAIAIVSAMLSAVSWIYRFIEEHSRYQEIWFYILFPVFFWALFAGPLFLILNNKRYLRILAGILLVPTSLLWVLSILIGFFGLRIH